MVQSRGVASPGNNNKKETMSAASSHLLESAGLLDSAGPGKTFADLIIAESPRVDAASPGAGATVAGVAHGTSQTTSIDVDDELAWFRAHKEELRRFEKDRARASLLDPRAGTGLVGLANQGSTCYLNSLLQALHATTELRERIYRWAPPKPLESAAVEARCMPLQLQKLLARLQLSEGRAVSTKGLTDSFGWTGGQ